MDSLVASAARSLAAGDPLAALKRIALRDDPPALALRRAPVGQRSFGAMVARGRHCGWIRDHDEY